MDRRSTLRDHRNEILRTILGGLGVAVVLAATGWPTDIVGALLTLLGAVAGVMLAFGVEQALDRRVDVGELQQRVRDLEAAAEQDAADRKMLEYRLALAQRESAINANFVEVWGGAYNEAQTTGGFLPFEALMARLDVTSKAKGLDVPIPKP